MKLPDGDDDKDDDDDDDLDLGGVPGLVFTRTPVAKLEEEEKFLTT